MLRAELDGDEVPAEVFNSMDVRTDGVLCEVATPQLNHELSQCRFMYTRKRSPLQRLRTSRPAFTDVFIHLAVKPAIRKDETELPEKRGTVLRSDSDAGNMF